MKATKLCYIKLSDIQNNIESLRNQIAKQKAESSLDKKINSLLKGHINSITAELLLLDDILIDLESCRDDNELQSIIKKYHSDNE